MSNTIVTLLLCSILKAIKPELDPTPAYVVIFSALVVDCCRLACWVDTWRSK